MTRRILGIDPGGNTGFAHGRVGGSPINGLIRLPSASSNAKRFTLLEGRLRHIISMDEITDVYVEAPFVQPDPTKFDIRVVRLAYGYQAAIGMACDKEGIPQDRVTFVEPSVWRTYFLNTTRAPKHIPSDKTRDWLKMAAVNKCKDRGWDPKSIDSAEACGIWEYGCATVDPKSVEGTLPLFAQLHL